MEQHTNDIAQRAIAATKVIRAIEFQKQDKRLAVLGPGEGEDGRWKREQIRDVLRSEGYDSFFPEDAGIRVDEPGYLSLRQELDMLRQDNVLPIMLMTEHSMGIRTEVARFFDEPDIMDKLTLLFPKDYYDPEHNDTSRIAREVKQVHLYTQTELQDCLLLSECRKWAQEWSTGKWLGELPPDETLWDSEFGRT